MSLSGPLTLLAILVLSVLLLVGLLPFGLRWLAARNQETRRRYYGETAAIDRSLLDSAERLRPFRQMKAVHFQQQRENVRKHLLEAREERRDIDGRLNRVRLVQLPAEGWPGEFFLRQPANYFFIPLDTWRLWHVGRHVRQVKSSLELANTEQETLHDLPNALRQAAVDLREQTLPTLVRAIKLEKNAGLGRFDPIELRLQQLQQRATGLANKLIAGSNVEDRQTDELALELEAVTTTADTLNEEITTIHRQRLKVDQHRSKVQANHDTLLHSLPLERLPENLVPVLGHIDALFRDAEQQRGLQEFEQCEACLNAAGQFIELCWQLYQSGLELEKLVEVQSVSPLSEKIQPVLNQWPPLIKQTQELIQSNDGNVSGGTHALVQMAGRIQAQAQKILADHNQAMNLVESRADQALDGMAAAWDKVQTVVPLAGPDPLARSYHALWPKREAARGIPQLLEDFIVEAGQLTRQIEAARANLQDHQRYMQETLGRLPKILAEAQQTAEDWLSLQRLSEHLAAYRVSLEELYQTTFTAKTIEALNGYLTEFQAQVDQLHRIQEELRFEAFEIGRLDNLIRDHWDALQQNAEGISEAKYNRAVRMTDTQYELAISAERPKDTRAALEKCLSYVEKLALN